MFVIFKQKCRKAWQHTHWQFFFFFTTKMFISIHLKQLQDIERFTEECNTQKWFIKQPELPSQPFTRSHTGPNSKSEQNQLTVDKPQRGKGEEGVKRKKGRRESVQHMEGRGVHKTGEDGWSATPVSLQTGKRQRRVEPRNSAGHSAPQHATPCHHRTAPHLNS